MVEGPNRKSARHLAGFMDLNDTVIVIVDVISRFKSLWTGMTHPYKFKDRVCTLLLFKNTKFQKLFVMGCC